MEYEPCPIPIEKGKTSLCLFSEIETEVDRSLPQPSTVYEKWNVFDNCTNFYPYIPKRLVRNGEIIDQMIYDLESQDEINTQDQLVKLKKDIFSGHLTVFNFFDRAKVKK